MARAYPTWNMAGTDRHLPLDQQDAGKRSTLKPYPAIPTDSKQRQEKESEPDPVIKESAGVDRYLELPAPSRLGNLDNRGARAGQA
jgi:hypothetical protein